MSANKRKIRDANVWLIDCGATNHITPFRELLTDFTQSDEEIAVDVANSTESKVMGRGTVVLKVCDKNGGRVIKLSNVLLIPDFSDNLFSVRQVDKLGFNFHIEDGKAVVGMKKGESVITGDVNGEMYQFEVVWYEIDKNVKVNLVVNDQEDVIESMRVEAKVAHTSFI